MIVDEIEHDYVDVKTDDFVKEIDVSLSEQGVSVWLHIHDYTDSGEPYLEFHVNIPWEPLIEEAAEDAVDSCRGGISGDIDIEDLTELHGEWVAMIANFNRGLRTLSAAINGAKAIDL